MDLNVIKNKAENVYGGENTTEYKEFEEIGRASCRERV